MCGVFLLSACQDNPDESKSDVWPTLPDTVASPDRGSGQDLNPNDLGPPDCPSLGDAGAVGWRIAWSANVPLHGMSCVQGHVYIAGEKATLLHHAPGSPQCGGFTKQSVPTTADLLTVSFADLTYGVTAGRDWQIWETHDEGKTWTIAPQCGSTIFAAFHSLHLHSATKGYGAGELKDFNGAYKIYPGKTWICTDQNFANAILYDAFRLADGGWFVGDTNGRIYHTPDEGSSWFYGDTTPTKPLRGVAITSKYVGLAVGDEGVIQRSEDGLSWTQVKTLGTDDLREVFFFDDDNAWIVGASGTIMHSTDAGQTWTYQSVATTDTVEAVCFTSATDGWAVTDKGDVLYTTTGGE
jgi:photosystem II stability/assembly factor-like uncharacterized protein